MAGGNGSLILDSLLSELGSGSGGGSATSFVSDKSLEDLHGIHADMISDEDGVSSGSLRVPKYFQAIITLVVCGLLLLGTLGIIKQAKKLCQKSSCAKNVPMIRVDSAKDGTSDGNECGLDSVIVGNNGTARDSNCDSNHAGDRHFDCYKPPSSGNGAPHDPASKPNNSTGKNNLDLVQDKRVRFVRRASGPYSDEAIDYIGQTYEAKAESKYKGDNNNKAKGAFPSRSSTIKKTPPAQTTN